MSETVALSLSTAGPGAEPTNRIAWNVRGVDARSILVADMSAPPERPAATNFVRDLVIADNEQGTFGGRVQTRFPPEPNGYLHIGHAKAITLDFGIAAEFGGMCNLRFDDTNPDTEETSYVDGIIDDLAWLGFEPGGPVLYASDYFEQLYEWAELLITDGMALRRRPGRRDDLANSAAATASRASRARTATARVEENLDLFRRMRAGEFDEGRACCGPRSTCSTRTCSCAIR